MLFLPGAAGIESNMGTVAIYGCCEPTGRSEEPPQPANSTTAQCAAYQ